MIDHVGIEVGDLARATEFYLKALAPLGIGIVMQVSAEETGGGAAVGFGVHGNRLDAQFAARSLDAEGNLAPVGNKDFLEHGKPSG